jgi:hypothetical protein
MLNRYVDILNRIRQNANLNWLTPSQQGAYQLVRERLKFLDEVNLWGHHGVGKTFLGWMLWKQGLAVYAPRLEDVGPPLLLRTVIIDNLGWRRAEVREILRFCRSMGYDKMLLITTEPVQEQISVVELALTSEDTGRVVANLRSVGVMPYGDTPRNLWDLVSPLDLNE